MKERIEANRNLTGTGTVDIDTAKAIVGMNYSNSAHRAETRTDREAVITYGVRRMLYMPKVLPRRMSAETVMAMEENRGRILAVLVRLHGYTETDNGLARNHLNGYGDELVSRKSARHDRPNTNADNAFTAAVTGNKTVDRMWNLPNYDEDVNDILEWYAKTIPGARVTRNQNGMTVTFHHEGTKYRILAEKC